MASANLPGCYRKTLLEAKITEIEELAQGPSVLQLNHESPRQTAEDLAAPCRVMLEGLSPRSGSIHD